jgi:hypothetical protein
MNARLLAQAIETLDAEVFALVRPHALGLPGWEARCAFVANDLRMLRAELDEELQRATNPAPSVSHSAGCVRDEDGVMEFCSPDCPQLRAAEGVF